MSSATRKGRSSTKNGSTKFKPTFNYLVAIGDEECARTMLGAMYRNLLEAREIISELPYGVDEERNYYGVGKKVSEPIEVEPYCDSWSLSELELKMHTPFCREPVLAFNPKIDSEVILHRRKEYIDEYEPELFVSMPRKNLYILSVKFVMLRGDAAPEIARFVSSLPDGSYAIAACHTHEESKDLRVELGVEQSGYTVANGTSDFVVGDVGVTFEEFGKKALACAADSFNGNAQSAAVFRVAKLAIGAAVRDLAVQQADYAELFAAKSGLPTFAPRFDGSLDSLNETSVSVSAANDSEGPIDPCIGFPWSEVDRAIRAEMAAMPAKYAVSGSGEGEHKECMFTMREDDEVVLRSNWKSDSSSPIELQVCDVFGHELGFLGTPASLPNIKRAALACMVPHLKAKAINVNPFSGYMRVEVELDPTDEGELLSVARTMLDSEPAERGKLSLTSPNAQKLYAHKRADLEKAEEERARAEEEARKAEFENGPVARQLKDLIVLYTGCVPYSREEVASWQEDKHRISNGAFSRKNDLSEGYEGKTWLEAFEQVVSGVTSLYGMKVPIPCFDLYCTEFYPFEANFYYEYGIGRQYWYKEDYDVYKLLSSKGASLELPYLLGYKSGEAAARVRALFHCEPRVAQLFYDEHGAVSPSDFDANSFGIKRELLGSWNIEAYRWLRRNIPEKVKNLKRQEFVRTDLLPALVEDKKDSSVVLTDSSSGRVLPCEAVTLAMNRDDKEGMSILIRKLKFTLDNIKKTRAVLEETPDFAEQVEELDALRAARFAEVGFEPGAASRGKFTWNEKRRVFFAELCEVPDIALAEEFFEWSGRKFPGGLGDVYIFDGLTRNCSMELFEFLRDNDFDFTNAATYEALKPTEYRKLKGPRNFVTRVIDFLTSGWGFKSHGHIEQERLDAARDIIVALLGIGVPIRTKDEEWDPWFYNKFTSYTVARLYPDDEELKRLIEAAGYSWYME